MIIHVFSGLPLCPKSTYELISSACNIHIWRDYYFIYFFLFGCNILIVCSRTRSLKTSRPSKASATLKSGILFQSFVDLLPFTFTLLLLLSRSPPLPLRKLVIGCGRSRSCANLSIRARRSGCKRCTSTLPVPTSCSSWSERTPHCWVRLRLHSHYVIEFIPFCGGNSNSLLSAELLLADDRTRACTELLLGRGPEGLREEEHLTLHLRSGPRETEIGTGSFPGTVPARTTVDLLPAPGLPAGVVPCLVSHGRIFGAI